MRYLSLVLLALVIALLLAGVALADWPYEHPREHGWYEHQERGWQEHRERERHDRAHQWWCYYHPRECWPR